jgi:hypothetical protein
MHFSFYLLRIKGLYMFRALLAHPQKALHKWHLVYCVRVMSADCATITVSQEELHKRHLQSWYSQLTLHARNIQSAVRVTSPEDEQVMLEICRGPWFSVNLLKSASRWFHYTDILWCTVNKILWHIFDMMLKIWWIVLNIHRMYYKLKRLAYYWPIQRIHYKAVPRFTATILVYLQSLCVLGKVTLELISFRSRCFLHVSINPPVFI